jgi:hypothetical protein
LGFEVDLLHIRCTRVKETVAVPYGAAPLDA